MGSKKFSGTFDEKLLEKVDMTANDMGLTRSAFLAVAVNNYFYQIDSMKALNELPALIEKVEKIASEQEKL